MDNKRLLIKLSKMYYEQNLSQKEISQEMNISRPQISRFLQKAREENIVTIRINDSYEDEAKLENQLKETFQLTDAVVINTVSDSREAELSEFGRVAANFLDTYINDGDIVGVMSGRTIFSLVQGVERFSRKGLKIVPLAGGLGSRNADWHANTIAQNFARSAKGSVAYMLNAPSVMKSEAGRDLLLSEPDVSAVQKLGSVCDVAILGIGMIDNSASNVVAGALTEDEVLELKNAGAVGSMCISYFNNQGVLLHPDIERRMIGQRLEAIQRVKKIALAIGNEKAEAVKAALKTGFVDVFITNMKTAQNILSK